MCVYTHDELVVWLYYCYYCYFECFQFPHKHHPRPTHTLTPRTFIILTPPPTRYVLCVHPLFNRITKLPRDVFVHIIIIITVPISTLPICNIVNPYNIIMLYNHTRDGGIGE